MYQFLAYGGFGWHERNHITEQSVMSLPDDSEVGYIFEIDFKYSKYLHPLHNEYPVAPERVNVEVQTLSPYARSLLNNKKILPPPPPPQN